MSYAGGSAGLGQTTADLIPDPWTQRKAAEFKAAIAAANAMPGASGLGQMPTRTHTIGLSPLLVGPPSHDYIARRVAALSLEGLGASMVEQVHPDGTVFTGRRDAMQPLRSFRHFDTGSKIVAPAGHYRPSHLVLGQTDPSTVSPPVVKPVDIGMLIGWGALVVTAVGLFWATTSGVGMGRTVKANLSDASRRRLPKKAFVFPGRRAWPIDTRERAFYAIQALRMGRVSSASDFNTIRNAIRRRYPSVWREYGRRLSWESVKRAKLKGTAHRRHRRRRAA